MATNRQLALDCATRIMNTMLMQEKIEVSEGITSKILVTADKFAEWLGPEPVKQGWSGQKQEKPTYDKPCPVCKGEMEDQRGSKKNASAPDARCKNRGRWNDAQKKFDGCQGVIWPEQSETPGP